MSTLSRFEQTIFRKNPAGTALIAFPGARVNIYGRGATILSTDPTIDIPHGESDITVDGLGDLVVDSTVIVGVGGPELEIKEAPTEGSPTTGPTLIKVNNAGALIEEVPTGTRLILTSARPSAYHTPLATGSITPPLLEADGAGRVVAYVDRRWFDYVVEAPPVEPIGVMSDDTEHKVAASSILSWDQEVESTDEYRCLFVGVAWYQADPLPPLSAWFGSLEMELVGTEGTVALYALDQPPAGTFRVAVHFDGAVNAVGGAIVLTGVDPLDIPVSPATSSGTSDAPVLNDIPSTSDGVVVTALSLILNSLSTQVTGGSSPTVAWNHIGGSSPTKVRGVGGTQEGAGSTTDVSWTLNDDDALDWACVGMNMVPISYHEAQLFVNVQGTTQGSPDWINARDFPELQAAVNALPSSGGVVYLPAGTYFVAPPLLISKPNVTLRGDGSAAVTGAPTIIQAAAGMTDDLIRVTKSGFALHDIHLVGSPPTGAAYSALVLTGADEDDPLTGLSLHNMVASGQSLDGLHVRDVDGLLATNCQFSSNNRHGALLDATTLTRNIAFVGCTFAANKDSAIAIDSCTRITLRGCSFVGNLLDSGPCAIAVTDSDSTTVADSTFSTPLDSANDQFIACDGCSTVTIRGCAFAGNASYHADTAMYFTDCTGVSLISNVGTAITTRLIEFGDDTPAATEFGNRETDQTDGLPRIRTTSSTTLFGLSHNAASLFTYAAASLPDADTRRGALAMSLGDSASYRVMATDGTQWTALTQAVAQLEFASTNTNHSGGISSSNLPPGLYRVSYYVSRISGTLSIAIAIQGVTVSPTQSTASIKSGYTFVSLTSAGNITYAATLTGTATYGLYIRIEVV